MNLNLKLSAEAMYSMHAIDNLLFIIYFFKICFCYLSCWNKIPKPVRLSVSLFQGHFFKACILREKKTFTLLSPLHWLLSSKLDTCAGVGYQPSSTNCFSNVPKRHLEYFNTLVMSLHRTPGNLLRTTSVTVKIDAQVLHLDGLKDFIQLKGPSFLCLT